MLKETDYISVVLWLVVCVLHGISGYNIEVGKAGLARGDAGTQFGYTVAIVRTSRTSQVLLVGCPNRQRRGITGHGDVTRCNNLLSENITCTYMDVTEKPLICARLKGINTGRSDCEKDQRLGSTLAVNRKYAPDTRTYSLVTVCAPGWKNVFPESSDFSQNYMIGMCLEMLEDLNVVECPRNQRKNCWPYWPGKDEAFKDGQTKYAYSQAGLSATYSTDGSSQVVGAPGVNAWRGSYKFVRFDKQYDIDANAERQKSTLYYGYSIASANFKDNENYVVVGIPNYHSHHQGHTGRVEVLKETIKQDFVEFGITKTCKDIDTVKVESEINKDQVGTKFGAFVYTVDITGDGSDEIFVGAPYYSEKMVDEGRVFIYTIQFRSSQPSVCGPIGILSGGAKHPEFKDKVAFARFGTAIASAGDLNGDDYNDVVIGSPYEDGGRGAVYVYNGPGRCHCTIDDVFSQRIAGHDIDSGLRGFGWSLYGDEDVDGNNYPATDVVVDTFASDSSVMLYINGEMETYPNPLPLLGKHPDLLQGREAMLSIDDVLVGAYASDAAVMLRTRPIVFIEGKMTIHPNPLPLLHSQVSCTSNNGMLCFILTVNFMMDGPGDRSKDVSNTTIRLSLDADTLFKSSEGGGSRVIFRNNSKSVLVENVTIHMHSVTNQRLFFVDVLKYKNKTEPRDAWTKVRVEGKFELVPAHAGDFDKLDPILHESSGDPMTADVEFDIKCENAAKCSSDLDTRVELNLIGGRAGSKAVQVNKETTIYLDFADELQLQTDIVNLVNFSYRANFTSTVNADLKWHKSNYGKVGASCKTDKYAQVTRFNCSADSTKIQQNENFKVLAHFDISRESLITGNKIDSMKEFIEVRVRSDHAYKDINPGNNEFYRKIPVRLKYDIEIYEDNTISDEYRYKGDANSERVFTLQHIYYVRNNGPSFLPKTYVNISVPVFKGDVKIAEIKEFPSGFCSIAGSEEQKQTTKAPIVTTTDTFTIPEANPNRRKREVNDPTPLPLNQTSTVDKTKKKINCEDPNYTCEVIECLIKEFETSDKPEIKITLDVFEKSLAMEKGILEVHYDTEAKVTDPTVWFVGKVVPWNYAVSATKTTVFVVEQATLVDEIDLWIIFVSIGGALLLLILVILILWRCGFFKRKKHQEVQKWKHDSLYKRRSQVQSSSLSPNSGQPYSPIEDKERPDVD